MGGRGVTPNSEGMFRQTNFCQGAGLVKNRKSIWPTHLCRKKSDKDFDRSCCQITITWTWLQYSSGTLHALFQETSIDRQFYFYDILEHTQEQVFLSLWKGQLRNLIFPNARKPPTDEDEVGKKNWFRGNFSVLNRFCWQRRRALMGTQTRESTSLMVSRWWFIGEIITEDIKPISACKFYTFYGLGEVCSQPS